MYFSTLEIENIKCFGAKQILDLKNKDGSISPWTLILGDNGIGKTTLLKCLAWMQPVEETDSERKRIAKIKKVAIKPIMDDFEEESTYERIVRVGTNMTARVSATLAIDTKLGEVPKGKNVVRHGMTITTKGKKLASVEPQLQELDRFQTINLFAYSASRHMGIRNYDQNRSTNSIDNLFSESADLFDASQVLANLEYASLKEKGKGKASELFNKVKMMLSDLLPDVKSPEDIQIASPINADGSTSDDIVTISTPYGNVPLYDLSLGYKTMLAWAVDLALRMLWADPESDSPLTLGAVVVLDEIDLHLHPKWQREVRSFLLKHFPNTQFICTAHSPFMAQAAEDENLCVLNKATSANQVKIENSPSTIIGWRIGQIITSDLFSIQSERSPEVEGLIERRRDLLDKSRLTTAEKNELADLNKKIGELPSYENSDNQKLLDQINAAAKELKKKKVIK